MSWNSYIDSLLGHAKGHADKVCIIGLDGTAWTTAAHANHLNLQGDETNVIVAAMKNAEFTTFHTSGIRAGGQKYQFLREDENEALGKLKDNGAITIRKSRTGIVIAHTAEGKQQGDTNKAVATVAEYLESMNM